MLERFDRVRANSPADIRSRSEIAIWAVTSVLRNALAEPVDPVWPDWLLSARTKSGCVLWRAGKSPNARPVRSDRPRQNSNTRGSRLGVRKDCSPVEAGSEAMTARRVQ